jgi:hypothetical protein
MKAFSALNTPERVAVAMHRTGELSSLRLARTPPTVYGHGQRAVEQEEQREEHALEGAHHVQKAALLEECFWRSHQRCAAKKKKASRPASSSQPASVRVARPARSGPPHPQRSAALPCRCPCAAGKCT